KSNLSSTGNSNIYQSKSQSLLAGNQNSNHSSSTTSLRLPYHLPSRPALVAGSSKLSNLQQLRSIRESATRKQLQNIRQMKCILFMPSYQSSNKSDLTGKTKAITDLPLLSTELHKMNASNNNIALTSTCQPATAAPRSARDEAKLREK